MFIPLLFALPAMACTDFSGSFLFRGDEFDTELAVEQRGCDSATFRFQEGEYGETIEMTFDGVSRPTFETPTEQFAQSQRFEAEKIHATETYFWRTTNAHLRVEAFYRLDSNRNLIVEKFSFDEQNRPQGHYSQYFSRR